MLWIPSLALFGEEMFTSYMPRLESSLVLAVVFMAYGLASIVLGVWALVLMLKGVGEVQGFSAWRALGNMLLAFAVLLLPIVMIGVAAAILLPRL